jgi:DNA (cytosine-5)-methyltransferase 1
MDNHGQRTMIANGVNNPSRGMEPRKGGLASSLKASQSPRVQIVSDSGQGHKSRLQTEIVPTLRANTGAGHNNIVIQSHHPRSGNPAKGGTGVLSSTEYSYTIDSIPHIINKIRRLTPLECERLQGYPDWWTAFGSDDEPISDTQRYKCLGNAVTVNVIEAIMQRMHKNIDSV